MIFKGTKFFSACVPTEEILGRPKEFSHEMLKPLKSSGAQLKNKHVHSALLEHADDQYIIPIRGHVYA